MDKINFKDGTLQTKGYVLVGNVKYETEEPVYTGDTPLSAENLNQIQTNTETAINEVQTTVNNDEKRLESLENKDFLEIGEVEEIDIDE